MIPAGNEYDNNIDPIEVAKRVLDKLDNNRSAKQTN
jgi:hypothetical protein